MAERHGMRVAAAQAVEIPRGAAGVLLGDVLLPQVHGLGVAEGEHRREDPHAHAPRAQVGPSVDHAHLRVLAVGGRQHAELPHGRPVGVALREGPHARLLHQVALPVQLLVALERIERLEHAEVGAGNHRHGV